MLKGEKTVLVRHEYYMETAGAALAARRGLLKIDMLNRRSRAMYETLTVAELEEMAPIFMWHAPSF